MPSILTKTEAMLLMAIATLLAAAMGGPSLAQSPHFHDFADQRSFLGIVYAMDVFSNVPFAIAGLAGLACLWLAPARSLTNMQRAMALLFFCGLLLVALGSATYHLAPMDSGLALDRYTMTFAMAGLLGMAAAGHVSERAGAATGLLSLAAGLAAVYTWQATGNLLPWAVFQFGGIAVLWWLASLPVRHVAQPVNWALVIVVYGVAKLLEINDYAVFELTWHTVSGHTLKHIVAAFAAWPVIAALVSARRARQNAPAETGVEQDLDVRWSNA
ncbi:hypothetical protein [Ramlibacter albus]|uniref:Alkaline phytoceramidase n=1 Tax=Ramlibacter albus TaxID=2079448 RepID=A0A923S0T0_9BURK|nr:hypothetical protein [Ramlibacter albus]MBC5763536.1 hypothetical protein [Ramlibacter albus]